MYSNKYLKYKKKYLEKTQNGGMRHTQDPNIDPTFTNNNFPNIKGLVAFYFPGKKEPVDHQFNAEFLGNFYEVFGGLKFKFNDDTKEYTFRNAEAAFQASKFKEPERSSFIHLDGNQAFNQKNTLIATYKNKNQTDPIPYYGGYDSNKDLMLAILTEKFKEGTYLANKLINTHQAFLLEHNSATRDLVWSNNNIGNGSNLLGLILMMIRDRLNNPSNINSIWDNLFFACTGNNINGLYNNRKDAVQHYILLILQATKFLSSNLHSNFTPPYRPPSSSHKISHPFNQHPLSHQTPHQTSHQTPHQTSHQISHPFNQHLLSHQTPLTSHQTPQKVLFHPPSITLSPSVSKYNSTYNYRIEEIKKIFADANRKDFKGQTIDNVYVMTFSNGTAPTHIFPLTFFQSIYDNNIWEVIYNELILKIYDGEPNKIYVSNLIDPQIQQFKNKLHNSGFKFEGKRIINDDYEINFGKEKAPIGILKFTENRYSFKANYNGLTVEIPKSNPHIMVVSKNI